MKKSINNNTIYSNDEKLFIKKYLNFNQAEDKKY